MATSHIITQMTLVTLDGITQTAMAWANERGLSWETVRSRKYRGSTWEAAFNTQTKRKKTKLGGFAYGRRALQDPATFRA